MDGFLATSYMLNVEWLLAWYPHASVSSLNKIKMRGGKIFHRNTEDVFLSGGGEIHELGHDLALVSGAATVAATIDVRVLDTDQIFNVEVEVFNGSFRRTKQYVLPAAGRVPFMINVEFLGKDEISSETTLTLHGVFITSTEFSGSTPPPEFMG
jgi:hypothetical protein